MKNVRNILLLGVLLISTVAFSQSAYYPALKVNNIALAALRIERDNIELQAKLNPSDFLTRKLELYTFMIQSFLETTIPVTTDVALNSAYLNVVAAWSGLDDSNALNNLRAKIWPQEFLDLIDTVKK
jgi:hypothetical protein